MTATIHRHRFLGTFVDALDVDTFLDVIAASVRERRRMLVTNHNVNGLAQLQRHPELAPLFDASDLCFIDSAGVRLILRLLGHRVDDTKRLAVLDWIWPFFDRADRAGWTVAHIGSREPVMRRASEAIHLRHPNLRLRMRDGFFDPNSRQNDDVLEFIHQAEPAVLLVGMGMPRQERWLLDNLAELPPCVIITVGGILGFVGGERPTPPRWLGPLGLEWAFRVATEPRRLVRRYLVESWILARPIWHERRADHHR